jgi:hypothetical protein
MVVREHSQHYCNLQWQRRILSTDLQWHSGIVSDNLVTQRESQHRKYVT